MLLAAASSAQAAELIMVESKGCPWCILWHREIGPAYDKTPSGRRAPLRRVDLSAVKSLGLGLAAPVVATPTFVLVEDGREIGRITGYPGAEFFWGLLDEIIARLDGGGFEPARPPAACNAAGCPRQTLMHYDGISLPSRGGA